MRTHPFAVLTLAVGAVTSVALIGACSDSTTAPKSVAAADTIAIDGSTETLIGRYNNGTDSGYESYGGDADGSYIETDSGTSGSEHYLYDYRLLLAVPLPKLAGRGVLDSAKLYQYVCSHNGDPSDSIVVDHVNWGAVYTDSLSYSGQVLQANFGTLVRDTTTGMRVMNVTSAVQADYAAKRANSQFRIEYSYATIPQGDNWVILSGAYCYTDGSGAAGEGYAVLWSH